MKTLKTLLIFALLLSSFTIASAQTGIVAERFRAAQEAFDNSQFEKTLTMLDAMEKDFGKSPRIESLRAFTLRDLNRPRDAYLSVLAYFKLTEGKNLSNNAAHKSLTELRDTLKAQLETDLSVKKDNLQAERNQNADKAIAETGTLPKANTQSSNADPLAELEMWNKVKTSINANDYYLFLMRFPAGGFAKQAKAKMDEIGDPQWNAVKSSSDPFVYRDFVAKNPNSPFLTEAKEKMNALAAITIAWEQIKDSNDDEKFVEFLGKYSNSPQAKEVANKVTALYAKKIESHYPILLQENISGRATLKTRYDLNFTNNCKFNISQKYYFDNFDKNDEAYKEQAYKAYLIEYLIDLSLAQDYKVSTYIDPYEGVMVRINSNKKMYYNYTQYNRNYTQITESTETKTIGNKSLFEFKEIETAERFSKDLGILIKACKLN